jgi:hypothetical protein
MSSEIPGNVITSWEELLERGEGRQRLLMRDHPLRIHYGDGAEGEPIFFVRSHTKPWKPDISEAVRVSLGRRQDGDWALTFTLVDLRFQKTFMSLCWDLADRSSEATSESEGLAQFITALREWKKLMTFHNSDTLSESQVRGLAAELWFGFVSGHLAFPVRQIQDAWQGPLGSDQDYTFPGHCFEIKSVHADSTRVRISSAEQLSSPSLDLVLVTLTELPAPTAESWTLAALINHVESLHAGDQHSLDLLEKKLERYLRVDRTNPYYSEHHYVPEAYCVYAVAPEFPAIRVTDIPTDTVDVSYSIRIPAMSGYLTFPAHPEDPTPAPAP